MIAGEGILYCREIEEIEELQLKGIIWGNILSMELTSPVGSADLQYRQYTVDGAVSG